MAFSREIFNLIFRRIQFRQMNKEGKDSYYTVIGRTMVRISNHCTHMDTWEQYLKEYPCYETYKIISLVFEDYDNTFSEECLYLKHHRKKMIEVDEYVYKLRGNGRFFVKSDVDSIITSFENMETTNRFVEKTGKCKQFHRVSRNPSGIPPKVDKFPGDDYYTKLTHYREWNGQIGENKSNRHMKKTINENQLRAIVAESVKRVLKEGIMGGAMRNVYNDAKNGYAQGYDNFSDFAKGARDYVKNQDSDFEQERYKQYKQDYKNAPKNSEERGYYAQNALANKPGLGGRITRAASVPLQTGAYLAGRIARRFGGNSQVKEAKIYAEVLRMINEDAGHLYWHDENGKAHTNSRETWRGVEGTIYVYHGDWSDPEVLYDDEEINYWDLEESAWDSYKCECEDNGKEPSEQEFDNLPSSWFKEYLDYEYMPGRFGENY